MKKKTKLIRADEAQVLLLDRLLQEIRRVASDIKQQIPEGIIEPTHIIVATPTRQVITSPMRKPWFSISIVNDGPDDCLVIVNTEKSSTTPSLVRVGEPYEVVFSVAKIDDLMVWCDSGSASLRVRGAR